METYLCLFPQGAAPLPLHFYHRLPTAPVMAWLDPAEKHRDDTGKLFFNALFSLSSLGVQNKYFT